MTEQFLASSFYNQAASASIGDLKVSRLNADHGQWLKCDSRVLLRSEYPLLFAAMDTEPTGREPGYSGATMYLQPGDDELLEFRLPFPHADEYDGFYLFIYADKTT